MKNICVFASASNDLEQCFYDDAVELGELLGENGFNIVYGGSRLGLMYACASKVKLNGGDIIGVMPQKLYDIGCGNPEDCRDFVLVDGMRERKAKMDEVSDAVVALAGGFGTLEEVSEMIVQKQLGYNSKPIIFLNTNNYYDNLIKFFNNMIESGFAPKKNSELYYIAESPKDVIQYLKTYNYAELGFCRKF